jgi:hypothetical protein
MHYVSTHLKLPESVIKELKRKAAREKRSMSQIVGDALLQSLTVGEEPADYTKDPFNRLIGMARSGTRDGSVKHDQYLYGKKK